MAIPSWLRRLITSEGAIPTTQSQEDLTSARRVPPDLPPEFRTFGISVNDHRGQDLRAGLIPDFSAPIAGDQTSPWRVTFTVPRAVTEGADVMVWPTKTPAAGVRVRASFNGVTVDTLGRLPAGDAELDAVTLNWPAALPGVEPWTIDGQFLRVAGTNQPVVERGVSGFAAFERYIKEGEAGVRPFFDWAHRTGFNSVRVFLGYWGGLGQFDPRSYLGELPALWALAAEYGLHVQQNVFADTPQWCPDPNEQVTILGRVASYAKEAPWVRIEGGNELDDYRNAAPGLDADAVATTMRTWPVISSHGSTSQDKGYLSPVWRSADYHPARAGDDWSRKPGHNAWEDVANKVNVPTFASEIKRPDEDGWRPYRFFEAAAGISLMIAGGCFHSQFGKAAQPPTDPRDQDCADAYVRGALAVPLEYRQGSYTAGHLGDSPVTWDPTWQGRAHAKILGGRACVVLAGMNPQQALQVAPAHGWGLVEARGQYNQVLLLAR